MSSRPVLGATKDHHTLYATSFVDVVTGHLLDVVRGRSADDVAYWLTQGPAAWRQRIQAAAIDPYAGYLRGFLSALPGVTATVDHFHAIKLANAVVDDVRRRTQQFKTLDTRHPTTVGTRTTRCIGPVAS